MPVERLVAGPRSLNGALLRADGFAELVGGGSARLVHGPLLGDVRPTSAKIWVRAGRECEIKAVIEGVAAAGEKMTPGVKPGSKDTWDGYPDEREGIFRFIAGEKISGVFALAAGRHRSDAWENERPGDAYPIYEFMSSKLTNIHTHKIIDGRLFGYNAKPSFCEVEFDFSKGDPTATCRAFSIDDEKVGEVVLKLGELSVE